MEFERPVNKRKDSRLEVTADRIEDFNEDDYDAVFSKSDPKSEQTLEDELLKERRNKYILIAVTVVMAMICIATVMRQNRVILGNSQNQSKYDGRDFPDYHPPQTDEFDEEKGEFEPTVGVDQGNIEDDGNLFESPGDLESEKSYDDYVDDQFEFGSIQEDLGNDEMDSTQQMMDDPMLKFSDVNIRFDKEGNDLPFFWYIPRSAGTAVEEVLLHCHKLIGANGLGVDEPTDIKKLEVFSTPNEDRYVNVDLKSNEGIQRAAELGFVESKLADVVFASKLNEVKEIFHPPNNFGKCFTLIRNPVDRSVSLFYALKNSPWEHAYREAFQAMTIDEYAISEYAESNWLTRILVNKLESPIGEDDLVRAKTFLSTKCLVGLTERFEDSIDRFETYFGWSKATYADVECEKESLARHANITREDMYDKVEEGSDVYQALAERNSLDMKLYEYAIKVNEAQLAIFKSHEE